MRWRLVRQGLAGVLLLLLAGCATSDERLAAEAAREPAVVSSHLSDAQQKFLAGDFGLAERSYRAAVEQTPDDVDAWLGLAACYDQLRRFDLADKAYGEVLKRAGETPEVLNNIGYSYLLRGDLAKAQTKIAAAYERDPDDPTIRANVDKLNQQLAKSRGGS